MIVLRSSSSDSDEEPQNQASPRRRRRKVAIIGAGWGGLSAAHHLSKMDDDYVDVTVIEASPRVGGLVRDGFTTISGKRKAEAGQHGFWNNYHNIYRLLNDEISDNFDIGTAFTEYAEQGQYSPNGLEAVWPVYQDQAVPLPTGLAQACYTRFLNLPFSDKLSALPLVLAFSDFDDSSNAWKVYDDISFRDLCIRLGVTRRCYDEAFEPMILTGLFAPGAECSAAAALGMAYFFVLQNQNSFDVQWCRGNIGEIIFDPWIETMKKRNNVTFLCDTKVTGFGMMMMDNDDKDDVSSSSDTISSSLSSSRQDCITQLELQNGQEGKSKTKMQFDDVILAVGAKALNAFVRFCPELAKYPEFRGFANLRGTGVLATRLFLDTHIDIPYTANACWGFDPGVGMTMFDISAIHGRSSEDDDSTGSSIGSIIEVDYYHASRLLVMNDEEIVQKVKNDLDTILGVDCRDAAVVDAAVVRLPEAVNWYFPGSYKDMPKLQSPSISNLYFAGDIVQTRHGSWSQEKAFVTGMEAANRLLGRPTDEGVLPLAPDELHVRFGRDVVRGFKSLLGSSRCPFVGGGRGAGALSVVDFLW